MRAEIVSDKFIKALPVWERIKIVELNYELAFKTVIGKGSNTVLKAATSGNYRVWVNGEFVAFGPARAAKGFFKIDAVLLDDYLTEEQNVVVIDVCGTNVNSCYVLDQPSFVTAEILRDGKCISWTGKHGNIVAYKLENRVQKAQRYTTQRTFVEIYHYNQALQDFYRCADRNPEECEIVIAPDGEYLARDVRYPQYTYGNICRVVETGDVDFEKGCENPFRNSVYTAIGPKQKGFLPAELEEKVSDEIQSFGCMNAKDFEGNLSHVTVKDGYVLMELPFNMAGFIRLDLTCEEDCTVYVTFDEILCEGDVNFVRMQAYNCMKFYVGAGTHKLQSFEPYTAKYIKVIIKGKAVLNGAGILQYKHAEPKYEVCLPEDVVLQKIYDAAVESYLENAVDNFYDCPSRERAGWLCDSFFTARVEKVLTGENVLEKAFLNNFLMPERFPYLPKGMLPMCYPADSYNATFIPQWAMWFVLEIEEYYGRSGDRQLIEAAQEKVYDLLAYFKIFLNKDGLLEKLDGWKFIEWSDANKWVLDVNFPTNMLYARMLEAVATLYGDAELAVQAGKIKQTVRERSFNGSFFTDHEVVTEDGYTNPGDCSEVCQYYAFFTGTATKEAYPELWNCMLHEFGPQRFENNPYPSVAFANAFIGNYLRLELIYREGLHDKLLTDVKGYFAQMAEITGTLWEYDKATASCSHGFTSHVVYWLAGIYGVREVK